MKALDERIMDFVNENPVDEKLKYRIQKPMYKFFGENIYRQGLTALLSGKNLLLIGEKSTGKNVLAENLAYTLSRPLYNISFHVNTDASALIGTDTLIDGKVVFREGPIYMCAKYGGLGVLDEINMAKNEALAVLHSTLDYRRIIDVPGYDKIKLHKAARFIATMNYGYLGTRDLNEALLSRFVVIKMPSPDQKLLEDIFSNIFPNLKKSVNIQITSLFLDLKKKFEAGEISDSSVDLRGMINSVDLVQNGLNVKEAFSMGIVSRCMDDYEQTLVKDLVSTRFSEDLCYDDLFEA